MIIDIFQKIRTQSPNESWIINNTIYVYHLRIEIKQKKTQVQQLLVEGNPKKKTMLYVQNVLDAMQ